MRHYKVQDPTADGIGTRRMNLYEVVHTLALTPGELNDVAELVLGESCEIGIVRLTPDGIIPELRPDGTKVCITVRRVQ